MRKIYTDESSLMENYGKNYIDALRTYRQNSKGYTAQTKSSLRAQSQVVEDALKEYFEQHNVKIEA